ncbi:hypothetical protein HCN44_002305 [Aphidius gifuensis]|uniref:Uncharacterized protein n=1 Tax=Aphidius gifuensis TaxID=684658 RepID=A0A835CU44_APHGI|nr:hypothetical protein HCN44_002305 [Aphidius gifuensis]
MEKKHNRDHPADTTADAKQLFLQKTTLKDKFEVVWKSSISSIEKESDDKFVKSVDHSESWRKIGNNEFTTSKNEDYLRKSIEAYTKSIAFAPAGSNELSLAYANRSAVLFEARLYQDCLLDIERALKSGYPDDLKTKLFLRQSLCFKALKPSSNTETNISMANAMQWLPNLKKNNRKYNITKEYSKMMHQLEKPRDFANSEPGDTVEWSNFMMSFCKLTKRSCDPNVDWAYLGPNVGYYAKKPIIQGEPILVSTVGSYSLPKIIRNVSFRHITDDPVPCKCIACVENWPAARYLPSYQSMGLPISITKKLDRMTLIMKGWIGIIRNKDTKELLKIKDKLNGMNDEFHQYITGPCQEIPLWYFAMRMLYNRLHMVYHNTMTMYENSTNS